MCVRVQLEDGRSCSYWVSMDCELCTDAGGLIMGAYKYLEEMWRKKQSESWRPAIFETPLAYPSPPETMLIKCSTIRDHPSKTWVPKPRSASTWGTPKKYGSNPKQIFGKSPPWTGIFFTTCHQIKQTMQLCKQHAGLTWVSTGFCCPSTCTYALFVLCFFKYCIPSAVPHSENKENLLFKVSSPI